MSRHPDETPASDADEALLEELRAGGASDEEAARLLAVYRDTCQEGT